MPEPSTDSLVEPKERALAAGERERRAAIAVLLDPACDGRIEAALHLVRGWQALAYLQSIGKIPSAAAEGDGFPRIDEVDLPEFGDSARSQWETSLLAMLGATRRPPWEVRPEDVPDSALLRLHCQWLERALRNAGRRLRIRRPRTVSFSRTRAVVVGVILLTVAAAFWPGGRQPVWRVSYFDNTEFHGIPVTTGADQILFQWDARAPHPDVPNDYFSGLFVSCLAVPRKDTVRFVLGSDDGSRLFVDGRMVIDNWGQHNYVTMEATRVLEAGIHPLRIEYFEKSEGAHLGLWAAFGDGPLETLPPERLIAPTEGDGRCEP